LFTPTSYPIKKTVLAAEQDRPDVARRRLFWWQPLTGPFLYYPGRRLLPSPLRAFVDFIKAR
jgi:hypothetical protein